MKTLLLAPELFLADGGIARILRVYLLALCEEAGPDGEVRAVVLNDQPGSDPRLGRYSNAALRQLTGCRRSKIRFLVATFRALATPQRVVCGHLHQLPVAWLANLLWRRRPYYLVAHGIEVWRPYSWLERRALCNAHRILCISEYTRRQLLRFCPSLDATRLVVLPNSLDPYLEGGPGTAAVAAESKAGPVILTVARLTTDDQYKGVDTLIEALPLILREFPAARLRVVGRGNDEPRLRALVDRLQLGAAVHFAGGISDEALRREYAACDLFALPSRKEGFGLVFLEAMTHGKPCAGARAGGIPEVIHDQVGALCEYGDLPGIAAAVCDLIRNPRDAAVIRRHAESFAYPAFRRRLAAALQ